MVVTFDKFPRTADCACSLVTWIFAVLEEVDYIQTRMTVSSNLWSKKLHCLSGTIYVKYANYELRYVNVISFNLPLPAFKSWQRFPVACEVQIYKERHKPQP